MPDDTAAFVAVPLVALNCRLPARVCPAAVVIPIKALCIKNFVGVTRPSGASVLSVPNSTKTSPSAYAVEAASVAARVPAKDCILRVPIEMSCPVAFTEKPVSVIAPVVPLSLITLKPPLERTGPEKVVVAISISCRG